MADMLNSKKGSINSGMIEKWILMFVLIVVLFMAVAELYPTAADAGDDLNASGIPLGSFFVGGGILWLIVAAGLLFVVVRSVMGKTK